MLDAPLMFAHVIINGCVLTCRAIRAPSHALPGAMPASRSACSLLPVAWFLSEALPTACQSALQMTVRDALNSTLDEEMVRDENVFILGEEVNSFCGSSSVSTPQPAVLMPG